MISSNDRLNLNEMTLKECRLQYTDMQNYLTTGISIPVVYQRIERERGDVSRSRFILRLIEKGLDQMEGQTYLVEKSEK